MSKKLEVLVADDESSIRTIFQHIIQQEFGYNVTTAEDGQDALDKALGKKYDLIITDYRMPFKNGAEFYSELHKSGKYDNLAERTIVCTTARSAFMEELLKKGIDYSQLTFLDKPFNYSDLLDVLEEKAKKFGQE